MKILNCFSLILVLIAILITNSNCLHFLLSEGRQKCIFDEIPEEEDVKIEYQLLDRVEVNQESPMLQLTVLDPDQKIMKTIQIFDTTKKTFSFAASATGKYQVCFIVPKKRWVGQSHGQTRFDIKLTVGEAEEDIESIAGSDDLALLKEKAKKLENKCQNYIKVQDMNRQAEDKLYEENEKIDERVIFATVFQILVILASGIFQILSLRRFFIKIHVF